MTIRRSFILLIIAVVALKLWPVSVFADSPLETIQTQVNRALEVLRDPALKAESAKETKEKKIWAILDGVFDYSELSKRTLAQHWKQFTPDQQEEFIRLFGKLLGSVYMDRIIAYKDEKVVFGKVTNLSDKTAEVQSEVLRPSKSIPIHYRMILRDGEWKVYDVVIEGVSLAQNYRSQFREILTNKPPENLLKMLREKTRK
ncbi:MAG TPA: ABC transporter substrate-binding protein [Thermodesulfobacteriota bacterium]|nr:ABC transporter substrate-binding protein [Thermodesulfobacteriota bacterium]